MPIARSLARLACCAIAVAPAAARGEDVFSVFGNTNAITVADGGSLPGAGSPYPSTINVTRVEGTIVDLDVAVYGVTHTFPDDLAFLLVAPNGRSLVLQSDAGGEGDVVDRDYVFDDESLGTIPNRGPLPANGARVRPTSYGNNDSFAVQGGPAAPHPQPAPAGGETLASRFDGLSPNGTWKLYVVDCCLQDVGGLTGGWDLGITTAPEPGATAVGLAAAVALLCLRRPPARRAPRRARASARAPDGGTHQHSRRSAAASTCAASASVPASATSGSPSGAAGWVSGARAEVPSAASLARAR